MSHTLIRMIYKQDDTAYVKPIKPSPLCVLTRGSRLKPSPPPYYRHTGIVDPRLQ